MAFLHRLLRGAGALALAVAVADGGCRETRQENRAAAPPAAPGDESGPSERQPVRLTMRNVHLRMGSGISLDVDYLQGRMVSRRPGRPPVFDDQTSYVLEVDAARVSMAAASIAAMLNNRVFAQRGASIDDMEIETVDGELELKGDLNGAIDLPFTLRATVSPAGGSRIILHPTSLKALGIPAKGLLDFFGIELEELIATDDSPGVTAKDDDLLLDAAAALPPPRLRGEITSVRVLSGRLAMTIGKEVDEAFLPMPPIPDANYLFFSGSDIQFGKLTMHGSDLQLVDADPSTPFDFFPQQYDKQLVAGYSKTQPDGGLVTFLPDFSQAERTELPPHPPAEQRPSSGR